MRIVASLCIVLSLVACASQTKTIELDGNTIVVEDNIDIETAKNAIEQFLAQEKRFNISGRIAIERFSEDDKSRCNNSAIALEIHGDFCDAQYWISHSSDPYCVGNAGVIEVCREGKCEYRFSEYIEICE